MTPCPQLKVWVAIVLCCVGSAAVNNAVPTVVGNVVLKLSEGVFDFLMKTVAKEVISALPNDQAQAMRALQSLISRYDYSTFGGASLLGIDGICIICHGSSRETAIRNALLLAAKDSRLKVNEKIVAELDALPKVADE